MSAGRASGEQREHSKRYSGYRPLHPMSMSAKCPGMGTAHHTHPGNSRNSPLFVPVLKSWKPPCIVLERKTLVRRAGQKENVTEETIQELGCIEFICYLYFPVGAG